MQQRSYPLSSPTNQELISFIGGSFLRDDARLGEWLALVLERTSMAAAERGAA
jgi:hypothetical protein